MISIFDIDQLFCYHFSPFYAELLWWWWGISIVLFTLIGLNLYKYWDRMGRGAKVFIRLLYSIICLGTFFIYIHLTNKFCRITVSTFLLRISLLIAIPTIFTWIYAKQNKENRSAKKWKWFLLSCTLLPLLLIFIMYEPARKTMRNPLVRVNNVNIYDDDEEDELVIDFATQTYDLKGCTVYWSAEIEREYKQSKDNDFNTRRGPIEEYQALDGTTMGSWEYRNINSDFNDWSHFSIRVPYDAIYHKKGKNTYSVIITTHYSDYDVYSRNEHKTHHLYNFDGYHQYTHTFKTSNLNKKHRSTAKQSTNNKPAQSQIASQPQKSQSQKPQSQKPQPTNTVSQSATSVTSSNHPKQTAVNPQSTYTPEQLPPLRYTARTWTESSSAFGVNSHTTYTQTSDGWITREYHQQCTLCHGSGKCQICYGMGGKMSGMYYMPCMGCGGSGQCSLCKGSGEYMSSTTRYLPLDEYYESNAGVVHLSGNGRIAIFGIAANIMLYSKDFTVQEYGGYYHFGGNIGSSYLSYLPYPECRLSTDRNTLYIENQKYTRCSPQKYKNAQKNYELMCAQMGVQPYYFHTPDLSTSGSSQSSSSSSSSSMSNRYGTKSCYVCFGTGHCQSCNGSKVSSSPYNSGVYVCGVCGGTGICRTCRGTGEVYGLK